MSHMLHDKVICRENNYFSDENSTLKGLIDHRELMSFVNDTDFQYILMQYVEMYLFASS